MAVAGQAIRDDPAAVQTQATGADGRHLLVVGDHQHGHAEFPVEPPQ
jgi:hypothetical protein